MKTLDIAQKFIESFMIDGVFKNDITKYYCWLIPFLITAQIITNYHIRDWTNH